jgi:hypothetical protein
VLNGLESTEWAAELFSLTGMGDGELHGRVQGADDLHTSRPRSAPEQFCCRGVHHGEGILRVVDGEGVALLSPGIVALDN